MALPDNGGGNGTFLPVSAPQTHNTRAWRVAAFIALMCGLVAIAGISTQGQPAETELVLSARKEASAARLDRLARMEKADRPEIQKWRRQQSEAWESEKTSLEETNGHQKAAQQLQGRAPMEKLLVVREGAESAERQNAHLDELASYMLANGDHLSSADALKAIRIWNQDHEAILSERPARTQMLSYRPQSLAGKSLLCEKRAKIIELFDQLLAKLGGEELSANITMGKVSKEWHDALGAWLDSESQYRLTVEQVRDAQKGAQFSRDEYEKWKTAYKRAKEDLEATLARHAEERKNLLDERELIREIMRYIGVLHDVKATAKSIAAGGRDSIKDEETGVSDPYNIKKADATKAELAGKITDKSELAAKISKLKQLASKTQLPGTVQKLAMIQSLPIYSETEEVAKILKEILADLATRLSVINEVDTQAQKLVDDAYAKMVEWEKKLVSLADQADKAKEKMMSEKLQRERLAGDKDVAQQDYDTESAAYKLVITPYEREIYVITMIKIKINTHCDKLARGEESTFGAR